MSEHHEKSSFSVIPSYILEDEDLNSGAIVLYARLSMYSKEGRAWPSNQHLAEKQKVDERTIQKWLKQLKDKKYIEVEIIVGKNNRQTIRNIWINNDFKNNFKGWHIDHPPPAVASPPPDRGGTHINIKRINIKEDKYKNLAANDSATPKSSPPTPLKIKFSKNKQKWEGISDEDIAAWENIYPGVDINASLLHMEDWLASNPAKNPKSNFRAFITRWLTREQNKVSYGASKSHSSSESRAMKDKNGNRLGDYDNLYE